MRTTSIAAAILVTTAVCFPPLARADKDPRRLPDGAVIRAGQAMRVHIPEDKKAYVVFVPPEPGQYVITLRQPTAKIKGDVRRHFWNGKNKRLTKYKGFGERFVVPVDGQVQCVRVKIEMDDDDDPGDVTVTVGPAAARVVRKPAPRPAPTPVVVYPPEPVVVQPPAPVVVAQPAPVIVTNDSPGKQIARAAIAAGAQIAIDALGPDEVVVAPAPVVVPAPIPPMAPPPVPQAQDAAPVIAPTLRSGTPIDDLAARANTGLQFRIKVPENMTRLVVRTADGQGDVTLFAEPGNLATPKSSLHTGGQGVAQELSIPRPQPGWYYILVKGGPAGFKDITLNATLYYQRPKKN